MKRILIIASLLTAISFSSSAEELIKLEHTFNGYYLPCNFPVYQQADNDRYFRPMIMEISGNSVSLISYNEDYSVRDKYNVTYKWPKNYKAMLITYSPEMKLTDGTPFFVVSYISTNKSYGDAEYSVAIIYNAINGEEIYRMPSSSGSSSFIAAIYVINSKPSMLWINDDYNKASNSTTYTTYVYSLGTLKDPESSMETLEVTPRNMAAPILTYDMSGRIISSPLPGQPVIQQFSDGSHIKKIMR